MRELKNLLLEKFFKTFDLDKQGLIRFCTENNIDNSSFIIEEFEEIRTKIYDHLWKITEPNLRLNADEIVANSCKYLKDNYKWIDDDGIKSVNNFLLWMCWHEGILK